MESAMRPEREDGNVESDSAGKEAGQERAFDSEQSATAAHAEIEKKTDALKDRPASASIEPAKGARERRLLKPGILAGK